MKRALISIGSVLFLGVISFAQQTPTNPDPATPEQASKIIELMNLKAQMAALSTGMKQAMLPNLVQEFNRQLPNAPPAATAEVTAAFDSMFTEMYKSFSTDEMEAVMVQIYQKYLTRGEAEAAIAFYSSPEGQSFLNKAPVMGTEAMQGILPKLRAQTEQLGQKFAARMAEIVRKYSRPPSP